MSKIGQLMGDGEKQEKVDKTWKLCIIGMIWRMAGTRQHLGLVRRYYSVFQALLPFRCTHPGQNELQVPSHTSTQNLHQ